MFEKLLLTFGTAAIPVLELRGAIPLGVAAGLSPAVACVTAIAGNLLPVPFIMLLVRHVFDWLRHTRLLGAKIEWLERHAHIKGRVVQKYRLLGLVILVGIPLPGTGAWTGCLIASVLEMDRKKSFLAALLGVFIASIIMMILSFGLLSNII